MSTFSASIKKFNIKTKEKAETIFKSSAQEVFATAQTPKNLGGNMPVLDSILRNSLETRLNGSTVMTGPESYTAVISGWELGGVIEGGWTVEYARRMEYGFVGPDAKGRVYNQAGNFFVRNAVLQWQAIVDRNAQAVKDL